MVKAGGKGRSDRRALKKRFTKVRQRGSHVTFQVDGATATYAFHDTRDLGKRHLRMGARNSGESSGSLAIMSARARIPVHFQFDEESQNWAFHVDEPRIVGRGQATLDEARQAAAEAIAPTRWRARQTLAQ